MRSPLLVRLVVPALALTTACQSSPEPTPATPVASAEQGEAPSSSEAKLETKEDEAQAKRKRELERANRLADREHSLAEARLELQLAELDVAASRRKAEHAVVEARRELDEAQRALSVFLERERPRELATAQLELDRAAHRLELEQDELAELTAMYAAEDFAEMTKELVLKRGRKSVEFAERSLELERQGRALLEEEELSKQERELRASLAKAQQGLAEAEAGLEQAGLQAQQKLAGARYSIEKLERPDPEDLEDEDA